MQNAMSGDANLTMGIMIHRDLDGIPIPEYGTLLKSRDISWQCTGRMLELFQQPTSGTMIRESAELMNAFGALVD